MLGLVILLVVAVLVHRAISRDFVSGFSLATALLVGLPVHLRVDLPGALPELTVHRLIIIVLFLQWMRSPFRQVQAPAFFPLMLWLLFVKILSALFSISPVASIKEVLGYAFEIVLFCRMASTVLSAEGADVSLIKHIVVGLGCTTILAFIEKYYRVNLAHYVAPAMAISGDGAQSTYPHRILYGYAVVIGLALAAGLLANNAVPRRKHLLIAAIGSMALSAYFTNSRGPWLGLFMVIGITLVLGSPTLRRNACIIILCGVAVLLVRPGIRHTLLNKYTATFDEDSLKGRSYSYRWRLWNVAFQEISASPVRLLLGYGPLSTEKMDLSRYFEAQTGGSTAKLGYTSWDNQYAADMIELGLVGFFSNIVLYLSVALGAWRYLRENAQSMVGRTQSCVIVAAMLVYLFAMSNVYMFSPQLTFLFWSTVIIAFVSGRPSEIQSETAEEPRDVQQALL